MPGITTRRFPDRFRPMSRLSLMLMWTQRKRYRAGITFPLVSFLPSLPFETRWGKIVVGNAYFGVKGRAPSGASTNFTTHEVRQWSIYPD
jgi:hypothetical protein